jgi:hypothetical protein
VRERPAATSGEPTSSLVELVEDPSVSFGAPPGCYEPRSPDNLLVHGENLAVLRALAPALAGRIRCVYIDPPYNTGASFEHYDDAADHAHWLASMRERLVVLRELLADDGVLFVQIDDREVAYEATDLDALTLAYACSIHKAQGSPWDDVQVFAPDLFAASQAGRVEAGVPLWKRLAYVAITRAEQRLHWVVRNRLALPVVPLGVDDLPQKPSALALAAGD